MTRIVLLLGLLSITAHTQAADHTKIEHTTVLRHNNYYRSLAHARTELSTYDVASHGSTLYFSPVCRFALLVSHAPCDPQPNCWVIDRAEGKVGQMPLFCSGEFIIKDISTISFEALFSERMISGILREACPQNALSGSSFRA